MAVATHPSVGGGPLDEVQATGGGGDNVLREVARRYHAHAVVQLESGARLRPVVLSGSRINRHPRPAFGSEMLPHHIFRYARMPSK